MDGVHTLVESGFQWSDRQDVFVDPDDLVEDYTSVTPFWSFMEQMGSEEVDNPLFKLFEHSVPYLTQQLKINDAAPPAWPTNGSAGEQLTVVVDGMTGFDSEGVLGDYLIGWECRIYAETGSTYGTYKGTGIIIGVDNSNSTVTIEANGNPADPTNFRNTAFADNDYLYFIGKGRSTGSEAGEAFSDEVSNVYNSTEFQEFPVEVDGDVRDAYLRGTGAASNEMERLNNQGRRNFLMNRNRKLLFGVRRGGTGMSEASWNTIASGLTDAESRKMRKTMGAESILRTYGATSGDDQNVWTFDAATPGTSVTKSSFYTFGEKVSQYQPGAYPRFLLFAGRGCATAFTKIFSASSFNDGTGQYMIDSKAEKSQTFRFNVRVIGLPHCEIELVIDEAWRGPDFYRGIIINPDAIGMKRFGENGQEQMKLNIKTDNDYHGQKNVFTVDEGLYMNMQKTHHLITFTNV